ncbi:MAG: MCE family protein [Rhodocyclaceae bacterium]|nr:MCE family protein [Rhodocyclaceae bacterium]
MTPPEPSIDALPEARFVPQRRRRFSMIWLLPVVAMLIGAWLLTNLINQRGPTLTISFQTAEGIAPGKTRIRFKDVDIGEVREVKLAADRSHVLVTAQLVVGAEAFLAEDSRFWVVRPRVSGGKVSGIGTLLSGAYIGVDAGKSDKESKEFTGLEVAPILTTGLPGRQFVLDAPDIGSLDIGAPVYFRRVQVGEVVAHALERDGKAVAVTIFIHAPYDKHVKARTKFWNASGVDVSLDANGIRLQSQSVMSVMLGGIAFETPPEHDSVDSLLSAWNAGKDVEAEEESNTDNRFNLHPDRTTAMKAADGEELIVTANFKGSLRGLSPGAPVEFRGIPVGEVVSIGSYYDEEKEWFGFPVRIALYTERISLRGKDRRQDVARRVTKGLLDAINKRGLRAQLRNGSLLTGQLYVALDFFPEAPPLKVSWSAPPFELPTTRGDFDEFQASLGRLMSKLDALPIAQIGSDLQVAVVSVDRSLKGIDTLVQRLDNEVITELGPALRELRSTLANVDKVMASDSPVQQDLQEALREVTRAARSVRVLSDTLDKQPESLLRGKSETNP